MRVLSMYDERWEARGRLVGFRLQIGFTRRGNSLCPRQKEDDQDEMTWEHGVGRTGGWVERPSSDESIHKSKEVPRFIDASLSDLNSLLPRPARP